MSAKDKPVSMPANDAYRDQYDKIFKKQEVKEKIDWLTPDPCPDCIEGVCLEQAYEEAEYKKDDCKFRT